jgi:hypothetical protein
MKAAAKFKWFLALGDGGTLSIAGKPATKEEARQAFLRQYRKKIIPRNSKLVYGDIADYAASKVVKLDGALPTQPVKVVNNFFHSPSNLPTRVYGILGEEAHDFSILGYTMKNNIPESYAGFPVGIYQLVAVAEMRVAKQVHVDITEELK